MRTLLSIAALLALSGCANHATLTIYSQPEGAYITEKVTNTAFGVAPVSVRYNAEKLKNFKRADGCYIVNGFEATWVSGAKASMNQVTLCGSNKGKYNITFARPDGYPDIEKDLNFSLQLQRTRAIQQQAISARRAADAADFNNLLMMQRAMTPTNCTSYQVGNTIQTRCN